MYARWSRTQPNSGRGRGQLWKLLHIAQRVQIFWKRMRVIGLLLVVHSLERDWGHLKVVKFEIFVPEYQANFGPWTTTMFRRQSGAALSRVSHWNGHFFGYLQT